MRNKILIVDDVDFSLTYTKNLIVNRTNAEIITASDGKQALEIIRNERPDLVLMDLFMPEMNGDECCRIVKTDRYLMRTPVIILSPSRKEEDLKRCVESGCDDCFSKPILKLDAFFEKIKKYINVVVRVHPRIPIDTEVEYFCGRKEYSGRAIDISEGGILIECSKPLPHGSDINLMLSMPGTKMAIEAEGKVVRIIDKLANGKSGMGIKFSNVTPEGKKAIADYSDKA